MKKAALQALCQAMAAIQSPFANTHEAILALWTPSMASKGLRKDFGLHPLLESLGVHARKP